MTTPGHTCPGLSQHHSRFFSLPPHGRVRPFFSGSFLFSRRRAFLPDHCFYFGFPESEHALSPHTNFARPLPLGSDPVSHLNAECRTYIARVQAVANRLGSQSETQVKNGNWVRVPGVRVGVPLDSPGYFPQASKRLPKPNRGDRSG